MRKIRLFSLLLAGAVFLTACGNGAAGDAGSAGEDSASENASSEALPEGYRDWGYIDSLTDEVIGETTIGDNEYILHSHEHKTYSSTTIYEYVSVVVYDPEDIRKEVEFDGETYPVIYLDKVIGSEITEIDIPSFIWKIGTFCMNEAENLTSVTFHEGLTVIQNNAFYESKIETVEIPSSVRRISNAAFEGCKNLRSVTFGENSRLSELGSTVFRLCPSLEEITIPAMVHEIKSSVFEYDDSLEYIYFEHTEGWQAELKLNGEVFLDEMDVTDPEVNADNLRGEYVDYTWSR